MSENTQNRDITLSFSYNSPFLFPEVILLENKKLTFTNHEKFIEEWFTTERPITTKTKEMKTINDLKIEQTEAVKLPSREFDKADIAKSTVLLLNSDFTGVIYDVQKMISVFAKNIANDIDGTIFLENFHKFEKMLKPISKHIYYDLKKLFMNEVVTALLKLTYNHFDLRDYEEYKQQKSQIITSITPGIKKLSPENSKEIIFETEKYLSEKMVCPPDTIITPLEEIKNSVYALKAFLNSSEKTFENDIYAKMYSTIHNLSDPFIQDSFDEFLPDILKSNVKYYNQPKQKFHIKRYSHLIFIILYCIFTEKVLIKCCPACKKYFVSPRSNKVYCDGTIPETGKLCAVAGPQYARNRDMPRHKYEYEKSKKRLDRQLSRDGTDKATRNSRKEKLKSYYTNELKSYKKELALLRNTIDDKNTFQQSQLQLEDQLIEKVNKKSHKLAFDAD